VTVIAIPRTIGPVPLDVVMRERTENMLEVTTNPVEIGADVTDHANVQQKRVVMEFASSTAAATYAALVALQETRQPFALVTGLSMFRNMLVRRIETERDKDTGNILKGTAECQEIILVATGQAAASGGAPTAGLGGLPGGMGGGTPLSPGLSDAFSSAVGGLAGGVTGGLGGIAGGALSSVVSAAGNGILSAAGSALRAAVPTPAIVAGENFARMAAPLSPLPGNPVTTIAAGSANTVIREVFG
jgi:hypothetical protein